MYLYFYIFSVLYDWVRFYVGLTSLELSMRNLDTSPNKLLLEYDVV